MGCSVTAHRDLHHVPIVSAVRHAPLPKPCETFAIPILRDSPRPKMPQWAPEKPGILNLYDATGRPSAPDDRIEAGPVSASRIAECALPPRGDGFRSEGESRRNTNWHRAGIPERASAGDRASESRRESLPWTSLPGKFRRLREGFGLLRRCRNADYKEILHRAVKEFPRGAAFGCVGGESEWSTRDAAGDEKYAGRSQADRSRHRGGAWSSASL